MLRIVLIGVSLVTTALTSYYAKRKLSKRYRDLDLVLDDSEATKPTARTKKPKSPSLHRVLKNGELT